MFEVFYITQRRLFSHLCFQSLGSSLPSLTERRVHGEHPNDVVVLREYVALTSYQSCHSRLVPLSDSSANFGSDLERLPSLGHGPVRLLGIGCCFSSRVHVPPLHYVPRPSYAFTLCIFKLVLKYASAPGRCAAEGDGHGVRRPSSA